MKSFSSKIRVPNQGCSLLPFLTGTVSCLGTLEGGNREVYTVTALQRDFTANNLALIQIYYNFRPPLYHHLQISTLRCIHDHQRYINSRFLSFFPFTSIEKFTPM